MLFFKYHMGIILVSETRHTISVSFVLAIFVSHVLDFPANAPFYVPDHGRNLTLFYFPGGYLSPH